MKDNYISPGSHSSDAKCVEDADQHLEKEDEEKDHEVDRAVISERRGTIGILLSGKESLHSNLNNLLSQAGMLKYTPMMPWAIVKASQATKNDLCLLID